MCSISDPAQLPKDVEQDVLSPYNRTVQTYLAKLGTMQNVAVLDYAPGNLGRRFSALLMSTIWHATAAMHRSAEVSSFFNTICKYVTVLVLHDARNGESEDISHTDIIRSRIKLAEQGCWEPLITELIDAKSRDKPKIRKPKKT